MTTTPSTPTNNSQALELDQKRSRIESALKNPDIDVETKQSIREKLSSIDYDLQLLVDGGDDILIDVLRSKEYSCGCHRPMCPLSMGEIPSAVEYRDRPLLSALREYERRHKGANIVRTYREARSEKIQHVTRVLDTCEQEVM